MFEELYYETADPRVRDYFLCGTPWLMPAIIISYLLFIFKVGPYLMKNRPAFQLKNTLMIYNILQIVINIWAIYQAIPEFRVLDIRCTKIDKESTPLAVKMIYHHYFYFAIKVFDLLDTIFIVLRKKSSAQLSFLHVYHHSMIAFIAWYLIHVEPAGPLFYLGFFNAIVHALMYFYYFLSACSDKYRQSLWWKKHLTQLQILQFVANIVCFGIPLLNPYCTYPKYLLVFYVVQMLLMIYLFSKFYIKAYVQKEAVKQK